MIIDSHTHIDQLEDLSGALMRAHEAGVSDIISMGVDCASMTKLMSISKQYQQPKIHIALGVHPGMVQSQELKGACDYIRANRSCAIAIGETGLDYWYKWVRKDEEQRNRQKDFFAMHLDLAKEYSLPIVIHSRGAWEDCLQMTKSAGVKKALFHWYSGPEDILDQVLEAGFYVSTSPSVGYSPESRRAMTRAPLERILIETDCPVRYKEGEETYLSEPKDVRRTLKALAQLKNWDEKQMLAMVNANAKQFFGI